MSFLTNSQELAEKLDKKNEEYLAFVKANEEALKAEEKALKEEVGFRGDIFRMGEKGYHKRRNQYGTTSHNLMDVSPRFILFPAAEDPDADIIRIVNFCRENKRRVAIRTGGHQYCAYSSTSPDNVQIDVSKCYHTYEYDEKENTLRCGVSWPLGDWAAENNKNGIYLPMGVCAHVHLGGHVHTGGWGMVGRSHGLLADHVLSIEVILADGTKQTVVRPEPEKTSQDNDDLYYAILGGGRGGDFGIVTHYTFRPLRDADYPDSANFTFMWLRTKKNTRRAMKIMKKYTEMCASGEIPQDYEFMITMTGAGFMNVIPDHMKGDVKAAIGHLINELTNGQLYLPAVILCWFHYSNATRGSFDPKWFKAFEDEDKGLGKALVRTVKTQKDHPENTSSYGMANYFIFHPDRELSYPFVKRSRCTYGLNQHWPILFAERAAKIGGTLGSKKGLHFFGQPQIYAGGKVAEYGKLGITSYSWRDTALFTSFDAFYDVRGENENSRENAEEWQADNDEVFIEEQVFADRDMRLFAFTWGDNRNLEELWPYFYDSEEKYMRLRKIKARFDPNCVFNANPFSISPIAEPCADDEKQ